MGKVQCAVYSPQGELLRLSRAVSVSSRTWVRNGIGTAQVFIPASAPQFSTLIGWGNLVRLNEDGVPPWLGVTVGREWTGAGMNLQLKSAEWLLGKKLTGQGRVYGNGSPTSVGTVAADLFNNAAIHNNGLRNLQSGLFDASQSAFRTFDYADLLDAYTKMAEDYGCDFWVDADLRVHFRNSRGSDKASGDSPLVFREGRQLVDVRVVESAEEVITAGIAIGDSGTDVPYRVPLQIAGQPFFRAEKVDFREADTPDKLDAALRPYLLARYQPTVAVDASVVKLTPGSLWNLPFWVGDIIRLVLHHPVHPNVVARVTGVELGSEERMRTIFEVIPPVTTASIQSWPLV